MREITLVCDSCGFEEEEPCCGERPMARNWYDLNGPRPHPGTSIQYKQYTVCSLECGKTLFERLISETV